MGSGVRTEGVTSGVCSPTGCTAIEPQVTTVANPADGGFGTSTPVQRV